MESIFEKIEIIKKPKEDNISTSNPKVEPSCTKKITDVYMAKKKNVMFFEETKLSVKEIKENYELLANPFVPSQYRLALPSELNDGDEVHMEYGVHILEQGDTLIGITSLPNCESTDWKEIASMNKITQPRNLRIGKPIVFPLKKSKQLILTKGIQYEKCSEVVVSESVHLVTEVKGFKKGESVVSKIEEEGKITQGDKLLTVTQEKRAKTELLSVITLENDDITQGKAISKAFTLLPASHNEHENKHEMLNFVLNSQEAKPVSYRFFNESKEKVAEEKVQSNEEQTWKERFDALEDKSVKLKVKSTSPSLPNKEEESEEITLEKIRSFEMFFSELSQQNLDKEDWNILASYEIVDSEKQKDLKEKYNLNKKKFEPMNDISKLHDELSSVVLDAEDQHILASYEMLDPQKREDLRKKYGVGEHKVESFTVDKDDKVITLGAGTITDDCHDPDVYIDSLEGTSICDGKYDVNKSIKEKPWTSILGFSAAINAGVSGTFESGVFRSKYFDSKGKAVYVRGQYITLELGIGGTATGADASFVATKGYAAAPFQDYLNGIYYNTGGNVAAGLDAGASIITTESNPVYHGITFDLGVGTPTAAGHMTRGYGEVFNVEEMVNFFFWKPWKDEEGKKPYPKTPIGFLERSKKILERQ